jgi:REP element-mobilizing transposase RayT
MNEVECPLEDPSLVLLSTILRDFKSYTANQFYKLHRWSLWQRGYYEHIIRSKDELDAIRSYIIKNPSKWDDDEYNDRLYAPGETMDGNQ